MIVPFFHFEPVVPASACVHPSATVLGRVYLGEHVSIWQGAVLRGDIASIRIGDFSNVQDNSVLHVDDLFPVEVGREVVVGHAARLHGATIGDGCLVGIGAIVLNGAVVEPGCIVAAGSLVPEKSVLEAGGLYMGVPARRRRTLDPAELGHIRYLAHKYALVADAHRRNMAAVERGERLTGSDWSAVESKIAACRRAY